jgi:S1-C subfamily serine protease
MLETHDLNVDQVAGAAPPEKRPPSLRWRITALSAAAGVIAMAGAYGLGVLGTNAYPASAVTTSANQTTPLLSQPQSAAAVSGGAIDAQAVAAKVDPAVVDINTLFVSGNGSGQAAGTGIILTSNGEVLTNNHVVEGATSISVHVQGRSGSYPAQVLGVDPTADVALIQIEGVSGLPTATLADSSTVGAGEAVAAIGNAGGVGGTPSFSSGTVVAVNQSITASGGSAPEHLTGMIESNATIAPGDSGGPLVNASGQVIGMTTAGQASYRSSASALGFAIPSNKALAIVNQVRSGQASSEVILGQVGYLGVRVTDLSSALARQLGLAASVGALVTGVVNGSPAAAAGLGRYAVITEVSGQTISSASTLGNVLHAYKPGDRVQITWTDPSGASHATSVTLTTGPAI